MSKKYLEVALTEIKNLKSGETFMVKDLFKGYKWKRIERNIRLQLGILFLNEMKAEDQLKIEILDKNSSNQQVYKIKKKMY